MVSAVDLLGAAAPVTVSLGDIGWQPHPEVWLLVAGLLAMAGYVVKVLEPKAVAAGYPRLTPRQRLWFGLAVVGLWAASDWPVHDVAERYLYAVHMFQHLFISMLVPAMFLLALPVWLFDLLLPEGSTAYRLLARGVRPVVAGLLFNGLTLFLHWPKLVQLSADSGAMHFSLHLAVFLAGLLMWMPVLSPVPAWRLPPIGQCIYLFMMSIVPTVPGGWLVFADTVVYRHYDTPQRLWGIDALTDQQAAGVVMKLVGGFFLWAVIVTIFSKWAAAEARQDEVDRRARRISAPTDLTYEHVAEDFSRTAAPREPLP
jgi:putative membrane protein